MTEENDLLNNLSTHSKKIVEKENIDSTYIDEMIDKIKSRYTQAFEEVNDTKSVQFKNLLSNVDGQINSALYINTYIELKKYLCLINDDLKKVDIINEMIETKRISVVVGGNGSGKSTFVNSLSNSGLKNLVVIPAQKNLFFVDGAFNREKETLDTYRPSYQKSFNVAVKKDGNNLRKAEEDIFYPFTMLITAIINGRTGATIVWCKNFIPNENHELKVLEENDNLPNSLLTELLGSKKEILFCEGKRNSYDYKILSSIYIDKYTVIPVGGHDRVISYTEAVNANKDMLENKAVGIIDRDGLDDDQVNGLKKTKVYCLPYNEIEMMLIDEEIIKYVLSTSNSNDKVINKIDDFKREFFELLKQNENRIINILLKNIIEMKLKSSFINTKKDRDVKIGFENAIKRIDVDSIETGIESNLRNVIDTCNYEKALKLCPLKNEVLKDLVNKTLQADYENFIVGVIQNNKEAQRIMGKLMSIEER